MYKVLIIDDEPIIRQGLKLVIKWEALGFRICGEAANGEEGLEAIEKLNPDLVVVDIKMPVMDGLQMIEELKKLKRECRIIILTGYPEFSYAQKAIELGVDAYVLKPLDENKLIEKVKSAHFEISARNELKENLSESVQYSRDKIIEELVHGHMDNAKLDRMNTLYELGLPWTSYQVVLIQSEDKENVSKEVMNNIRQAVEAFINKNNYGYVFNIEGKSGILLRDIIFTAKSHNMAILQTNIKNASCQDVLIAVGKHVNVPSDVVESYKHACMLLERNFIYGLKGIIAGDAFEKDMINTAPDTESAQNAIIDGLYAAIDVNSMEGINDMLEEKMSIMAGGGYSEDQIKAAYIDMYVKLVNRIMLKNQDLKDILNNNGKFIAEVYKRKSLIELNAYVKFKLISISDELTKLRPDDIMKKIVDYINRNYTNDIKLDSLAQIFKYNSAYLGQMFKNFTGEYFNTYLDKVRLEKAKQLLEQGLKVYQVAEKVGYNDKDYFVSKFKKYTGVSPTAYKGMK